MMSSSLLELSLLELSELSLSPFASFPFRCLGLLADAGEWNISFSASVCCVSEEDSIASGFDDPAEDSLTSFPASGWVVPEEDSSTIGFDAPDAGAISSNPSTPANISIPGVPVVVVPLLVFFPGLGDDLTMGGPRLAGELEGLEPAKLDGKS